MSIYTECKAAGVKMDNHESDLYVPVNEKTRSIVATYQHKENVSTFTHQVNGERWYDIPFAFDPWWDRHKTWGHAD